MATAELEREEVVVKNAIQEALAAGNKATGTLNGMRASGKDEGDDDKKLPRDQLAARSALVADVSNALEKLRQTQRRSKVLTGFDLPHAKRALESANEEFFFLGDPFALRSALEHEEHIEALDKVIEEGGAPGHVFLVRGLSHLCMRNFAAAENDFREAGEIDGKLAPLCKAAEARGLYMQEKKAEALEAIAKAVRQAKDDARVAVMQARIQVDQDDVAGALRTLKAALEQGQGAAEIHLILAWLTLAPPASGKADPATGAHHALLACRLSGWRDPWSLAALAVARCRQGKASESAAFMARALETCCEQSHGTFEAWEQELRDRKQAFFTW
jgi:tetratricopeptide (TPR) repeat protein